MEVVDIFGRYVSEWSEKTPDRARWLLKTGWSVETMRERLMPTKGLLPVQQEEGRLFIRNMAKPLRNPDESAIVSIFTPCELLQEVGLAPYSVEGFSSGLSGSRAEQTFLQDAENSGLSETLCSYHKTFIGAALSGVLPKPLCIVYTNLACDANLLTFRYLAEHFQVPAFAIDVPFNPNDENVAYVADQLRDLALFLKHRTGREVDEDSLRERVRRSRRTMENYDLYQTLKADRYIPTDIVTPLYEGVILNLFLGTEEVEKCTEELVAAARKAPPARGKRIYWMHTIPFWSDAVKAQLSFNEDAQIVCCEMAQPSDLAYDSEDPYIAMAQRMVYQAMNGPLTRRIDAGIRHARQTNADGVVWFSHWGCKHTIGGAQIAKKRFEAEGIPPLILDGDGCDRSHGGEGQTATRLGAFLEMLNEDRMEERSSLA